MSIPKAPMSLLVKLGSIARHTDEYLSAPYGREFDEAALRSLLADPEVITWIESMDKLALLPVPRGME